jgi:glycerol-3-phosphate dehydrogenase
MPSAIRANRVSGVSLAPAGAARGLPNHRMLSRAETLRQAPAINSEGLLGAAIYYDAQVEFTERAIIARQRTFALHHVNFHRCLIIRRG